MTVEAILLGVALLGAATLCAKPLGQYIADVMDGKPILAVRLGIHLEYALYRMAGVDSEQETGWKRYAIDVLLFSVFGVLVVYALQRLQAWLPLNPQQFGNVSPDSSFNTAVSFVTNTHGFSEVLYAFSSAGNNGSPVHLFPKEFDLLVVLARAAGCVCTHRHLLEKVWGPSHREDVQYLRVYVGQLREKLGDDQGVPKYIVNEPGIGYRLVVGN